MLTDKQNAQEFLQFRKLLQQELGDGFENHLAPLQAQIGAIRRPGESAIEAAERLLDTINGQHSNNETVELEVAKATIVVAAFEMMGPAFLQQLLTELSFADQ